MPLEGQLVKWNDERGFGFIRASQDGQEVFVHISAFPRDGRRAHLGERVSFNVERSDDGKTRAVGIRRQSATRPIVPSRNGAKGSRVPWGRLGAGLAVILATSLGVFGYQTFSLRLPSFTFGGAADHLTKAPSKYERTPAAAARCDGRIHCSQMTSCAEARFFLQNCPGVQMDGDSDGVPCEQQWCN